MPQSRLKGQDTIITVLKDGDLQAKIDSITNTEVTFELDILTENYLGETSERYDTIFKGMTFKVEGHMTNKQAIEVSDSIVAKAQRRAGGAVRIDMATTLIFPNGDLVTISVPDLSFQSIPITQGGREEYVSFSWEGKASEYELIQ